MKSPLLTAEWEHQLKRIERGEKSPEDFINSINAFVSEIVKTHHTESGKNKALFPHTTRAARLSAYALVAEMITKEVAKTLLSEGRIFMTGLHSEKTGKQYSATIILDDKGEGYTNFRMEFNKGGTRNELVESALRASMVTKSLKRSVSAMTGASHWLKTLRRYNPS